MLGNAQVAGLFPVVYCSDGFCDLTGFSRAEVMQRGCACSFLYGPDTSELVRQQIRKALDEHKEFKAELILYRKSGKALSWAPSSHAGLSLHSLPVFSFSYSKGGGEPPHVSVSDRNVCSLFSPPPKPCPRLNPHCSSPQEAPFWLASYQGLSVVTLGRAR